MNKEHIVKQLKSHVGTVTFTKVNGDERTMRCTLMNDLLPNTLSSGSTRSVNEDVVCVFDLGVEDWRSFRVDSILEFRIST